MTRMLLCGMFLSFLFACAGLPSSMPDFMPAQQDFAERLRWRDFAGAARHLTAEQQDEFRQRLAALEDLHITDFRLESAEFSPAGDRVVTWNAMEYYLLPSMTVKTLRYRQDWIVSGADRLHSGDWLIVTPFPPIPSPGSKVHE